MVKDFGRVINNSIFIVYTPNYIMVFLIESKKASGLQTTRKGNILDRLTRKIVNDRFGVEKGIDGVLLKDNDSLNLTFAISVSLSKRTIWLYDKRYLNVVGELVNGYESEFGKMKVIERYMADSLTSRN